MSRWESVTGGVVRDEGAPAPRYRIRALVAHDDERTPEVVYSAFYAHDGRDMRDCLTIAVRKLEALAAKKGGGIL